MHKLSESLFLTSGIMTLNLPFDFILSNFFRNRIVLQQPSEHTRDGGLKNITGNRISSKAGIMPKMLCTNEVLSKKEGLRRG
jgi:hypothetical protein